MKQNTVKVKRALQLACYDPSDHWNRTCHPSASLYGIDDCYQGSNRYEQHSGTAKENQTSELCRCLGNDKFSKKVS